jgi:ankyrin repeat protein
MPRGSDLVAAIAALDATALGRALDELEGHVPSRAMIDAARMAWKPGLVRLKKYGGDLNASYRNYRPLHALIQEHPHKGGSSTAKRTACLAWMLANGADPDLTGAWPSMRALIVAAFTGEAAYVNVVREAGARTDIFTAAALGNASKVETYLKQQPELATARDTGGMTALHCAAGSRMGRADRRTAKGLTDAVRALLDAGANPNEHVRSWAHAVDVMYFAIGAGQRDTIVLLLDRGADATAALPSAVWRQDYDTAELLLARGADVDRAIHEGRPLLNNLIRWGQFKPAMWLLDKGASATIADERGWTAVDQARSRGNERMLRAVVERAQFVRHLA